MAVPSSLPSSMEKVCQRPLCARPSILIPYSSDDNPNNPDEEAAPAQPEPEPEEEEPPVDPDVLHRGSFSKKADDRSGAGLGSYTEHITFAKPYNTPPRIFLGFAALEVDTAPAPSFWQEATNVTKEGFDLAVHVATTGSAKLWELQSVWIEVPDDAAHADVLVGTWDSAKVPGKPASDGTAVDSPFFPYKNFPGAGSGGAAKKGRRSVIPWLSGFTFDGGSDDEPFGIKVDGRSSTNDAGDLGATVSFRTPSNQVRALPKSARVSFLVFFPNTTAAGSAGLGPGSARAEFPNPDTDSITVLSTAREPIEGVAGVDMFQYLEPSESICLRVVDRQKEPDEAKYSLESWGEPLAHDLSAAIVKIPKKE